MENQQNGDKTLTEPELLNELRCLRDAFLEGRAIVLDKITFGEVLYNIEKVINEIRDIVGIE